jgi:DNA replication and repair protein RecF
VLALANRGYLRALDRYRRALAQRNAALRQQQSDLAAAFEELLAESGADIVRQRLAWVREVSQRFLGECDGLGEPVPLRMHYRGDVSLGEASAWPAALSRSLSRDLARGMTSVGPHRHDLELRLGSRLLRDVGSTGQQRTAAIALKLCELATLESSARSCPALLLDDVFAELDEDRQERLARRLSEGAGERPQTFLTAPRSDELPAGFGLDRFEVSQGSVGRVGRSGELVA